MTNDVSIRTGSRYVVRTVSIERRPASATTWSTVATGATTATGAYRASYTVPSLGAWSFRLSVAPTLTAAATTTTAREVTGWAAPRIGGITPTVGPTAGGAAVVITGTDLTGATAVSFGGTAGTGLRVTGATSLTVTTPAHVAGTVPVTVTSAGGVSNSLSYSYDAPPTPPPPTVTTVSPGAGDPSGGTLVHITGTELTGATAVSFGDAAGTGLTITGPTSLTVTTPAHVAGTVPLTVTTPGGVSNSLEYVYVTPAAQPVVTAVSPDSGDVSGGTVVHIEGTGLTGATAVLFGAERTSGFSIESDREIIVNSPAMEGPAQVHVRVVTPAGTSTDGPADLFTVLAAPTAVTPTPASGDTSGATLVTLTGDEVGQAVKVLFGTREARIVSVVSDSEIIVETPPASTVGPVVVKVWTAQDTSRAGATGLFAYEGACGTEYQAIVDVSGTLSSDRVWSPECAGVYRLQGPVTVATGASLRAEGGTTIAADANASLQVAGTFATTAAGTPVILTSTGDPSIGLTASDPGAALPAYWGGLSVLAGGTAQISGAALRWAQTGVTVQAGGSAVVTGSRLSDNAVAIVVVDGATGILRSTTVAGSGRGVVTTADSTVTIDDATFTGLQTAVTLGGPGATVSNSRFDSIQADTISVEYSPVDPTSFSQGNEATSSRINGVHLRNPVFEDGARLFGRPGWGLVVTNSYGYGGSGVPAPNVPSGSTVTVPADAVVKFAYFDHWPNYSEVGDLRVAGTLNVYGTLTKLTDDDAGGSIAAPGTYNDPLWGGAHFSGVHVVDGGVARVLPGSRLRYGASALTVASGGSAVVSGSELSDVGTGATFESGASGTVEDTLFERGTTGLNIPSGADVVVDHNRFSGLQTGVYLANPSTNVTNCAFDAISGDTISVVMGEAFDPARFSQGNVATNSRINGVYLHNPVFADGARLFGGPGWGMVVTNTYPYGVPYVPPPNVPAGSTVTVPSGAVVKFAYADHWPNNAEAGELRVAGTLNVYGTLTKLTDDAAGGPIAEPGTYQDPRWGNHFGGVRVLDGGHATLLGASVRYATAGVAATAGGAVAASGSTFVESATGIAVEDGATASVVGVAFEGGGTGLAIGRGARTTITDDSFTRMVTGISLSEPSTYVVDCTFEIISGDTIAVNVTEPYDPIRLAQGNTAVDSRVNGVQLNDTVFADGATLFGGAGWGLVLSYTSGNWWSPKPTVTAVPLGSSLSVPAGTVVKASGDRPIRIEGQLNLGGTPDAPVVFTSWRDSLPGGTTAGDRIDPTPGDWRGLAFADAKADTLIENAVFRYASVAIDIGSLSGMAVNRTQFAYNAQAFAVASTADSLGLDLPCVPPYSSFVTGHDNYYGAFGAAGVPVDLVQLIGGRVPEGNEKALFDEMTQMYNVSGPVSVGDNTIPWAEYSCPLTADFIPFPVTPILTPVVPFSAPPFPELAETI
ncbi:IPT/TIG domain-containing protein [Pedococcus sp. 2YAF34]|uniref:IPT/TIG domain-containing protein n=1 Tax=Pedococcus sp. 2YAF34 TaxID=3233032 RepID=UPI003F975A4B